MVRTAIAIVALAAAASARAAPDAEDASGAGAPAVRTLEDRVTELRQRVQATRERVRAEEAARGPRTLVVHRNEVGPGYWLESASYALDGEPFYVKTDLDGDLAGRTSIEVFDAAVAPGRHELTVELVYRGEGWSRGRSGEATRFTVRTSYAFQAAAGPAATITVVAHEQGGSDARPAVRFDLTRPDAAEARE